MKPRLKLTDERAALIRYSLSPLVECGVKGGSLTNKARGLLLSLGRAMRKSEPALVLNTNRINLLRTFVNGSSADVESRRLARGLQLSLNYLERKL